MRFEATIDVAAPTGEVFDTLVDVPRWPSWAGGVTHAVRLDHGPLRVGSRAWLRQPGIPLTVWEVIDLVPGRSFTWEARGPGLVITGIHEVEPLAHGHTRATAILEEGGRFGDLVARLTRSVIELYVAAEVRGLKAHCDH